MSDRTFGRWLSLFVAAIILVVVWGLFTEPPVPDVQESVTAERGYDWKAAHQRMARRYSTCHVSLVRAQDRLRRLGHRYSEEAHGWVRVR